LRSLKAGVSGTSSTSAFEETERPEAEYSSSMRKLNIPAAFERLAPPFAASGRILKAAGRQAG